MEEGVSTDLAAGLGAETFPQVKCVFLTQAAAGRATDDSFSVFVALENQKNNTNMSYKKFVDFVYPRPAGGRGVLVLVLALVLVQQRMDHVLKNYRNSYNMQHLRPLK